MRRCIPVLFAITLFCNSEVQSQDLKEKVSHDLVRELKNSIRDSAWKVSIFDDYIRIQFTEVFFANASISPIYNRNGIYNKLDTLNILIRLERNWSVSRMDSLSKNNRSILEPLIQKYIRYQDSVKWKNLKSSRELFLERPYSDLKNWSSLSASEKRAFETIQRLPNCVIDSVGIFVDSDFVPQPMLEPEAIMDRVLTAHAAIWKILNRDSLARYEHKY
jgi:hypothetical protein